MRIARGNWNWRFGVVGVGLLTSSALGSTPTFSFKLAGINGEMFRDIECSTDADCPAGSPCTLIEVIFPGNFEPRCGPIAEVRPRCVGGTTPGATCAFDAECGGVDGVCESLVERGDNLVIEAYVSGWDQDLETGICNNRDECTIALNDCTGKHCSVSQTLCFGDIGCPPGETCVEDDCLPWPLLGAYQWTLDCSSFVSTTAPHARRLMHTVLPCGNDDDCDHGYDFNSQCTCARAICDSGICSPEATAYVELLDFRYIFPCPWLFLPHEIHIDTSTCDYVFADAHPGCAAEDAQAEDYVGTMWLTVPMGAAGRYEVNFYREQTFVTDPFGERLPAPNLEPLVVEIPDPCVGYVCPPSEIACYDRVCRIVAGEPTCVRQDICDPESHCDPELGLCVWWGWTRPCCFVDGSCAELSAVQCRLSGGQWRFDMLFCDPNPCEPVGACCFDDLCSLELWEDCVAQGGDYLGDGVPCEEGTCPRLGACCTLGFCGLSTESGCMLIGGHHLGAGVPCEPDPCATISPTSSVPPHEGSLWRSWKNIVRVSFDSYLPYTPAPGQVEIVKLLSDGDFGPDLSAVFAFAVEDGSVLRIEDTDATLQHRKWYAIRNVGNWPGVAPFEMHYLVQMGDCDGDKIVISLDVGCVNAGIPCFVNCGDDNRKDIDGDGRVLSLDVGVVNVHIGSFTVEKPTGH